MSVQSLGDISCALCPSNKRCGSNLITFGLPSIHPENGISKTWLCGSSIDRFTFDARAQPLMLFDGFHTSGENNWRVRTRYSTMPPMGTTKATKPFEHHAHAEARGEHRRPMMWMNFLGVHSAFKCPIGEACCERQHDVRYLNSVNRKRPTQLAITKPE